MQCNVCVCVCNVTVAMWRHFDPISMPENQHEPDLDFSSACCNLERFHKFPKLCDYCPLDPLLAGLSEGAREAEAEAAIGAADRQSLVSLV